MREVTELLSSQPRLDSVEYRKDKRIKALAALDDPQKHDAVLALAEAASTGENREVHHRAYNALEVIAVRKAYGYSGDELERLVAICARQPMRLPYAMVLTALEQHDAPLTKPTKAGAKQIAKHLRSVGSVISDRMAKRFLDAL